MCKVLNATILRCPKLAVNIGIVLKQEKRAARVLG